MDYKYLSQEKREISEHFRKFFCASLIFLLFAVSSISLCYFHVYKFKTDLITAVCAVIALINVTAIKIKISSEYFKSVKYLIFMMLLCAAAVIIPARSILKSGSNPDEIKLTRMKVTGIQLLQDSDMITCVDEITGMQAYAYLPDNVEAEKGSIIQGNITLKKISRKNMYSEYLIKKKILYYFYYQKTFAVIPPEKSEFSTRLQSRLNNLIDRKTTVESGKYMKALIFGNKNYLDKKLLYFSRRCGVLHIFAASGMHVGIVIFVPMFLFAFMPKKFRFLISIFPVALYLYVAGFQVSLMRSSVMFFITVYAILRNRDENAFNCLFISGLIILSLFPHELYSLGFQLSFAATLAILCFYGKIKNSIYRLPFKLSESISLSLAVQILTLPILYCSLKEVNFNSIAANIIFIPFFSLIFSAGLICLSIPESLFFFPAAKWILNAGCSLVFPLAEKLSHMPFYYTGTETGFFLLIIPLLLIIIYAKCRKTQKVSLLIAAYCLLILTFNFHFKKNHNDVMFFSDSALTIKNSIYSKLEYNDIINFYISHHVNDVTIYLDTNTVDNIKTTMRLCRQISISKIFINENINYCPQTYFLFDMLEKEKIDFEIIKIDNDSGKCYDKLTKNQYSGY